MKNRRYGGFSDPIEENMPLSEEVVIVENDTKLDDLNEMVTDEVTAFEEVAANEVLSDDSPLTEIEKVSEPVEFTEVIEAEPVEEPLEEVTTNVDENATIQRALDPKNTLVKVISDTLNIRTGPDFIYPATSIAKRGFVYELLEEKDGWGKIDNDKWISLSPLFVERV